MVSDCEVIPINFPFPFTPYSIQNDFMNALFNSLQNKKLGIFESPTGTGKSLSLICGALTWLTFHIEEEQRNLKEKAQMIVKEAEGKSWFDAAVERYDEDQASRNAKFRLDKLMKAEKKTKEFLSQRVKIHSFPLKKNDDEWEQLFKDCKEVKENLNRELTEFEEKNNRQDDTEYILDDYCSDDDKEIPTDSEEEDCLKIFYCSRTHSQLSQFVHEINKTEFGSQIRLVVLASRQNLCTNNEVINGGTTALLNDRCLELQKQKTRTVVTKSNDCGKKKRKVQQTGCPYYKQKHIADVAREALLKTQDLEDLRKVSRSVQGCAYYGSRYAIPYAQVVVMPYNILFHKKTRESYKIKLKGNVVIVDEAHNLLETIAGIHSVRISQAQLCVSCSQISQYQERYQKRLSPKNLLYIKQILFFVRNITKLLKKGNQNQDCTTWRPEEFLVANNTDNLNLFKIVQYIEQSNLANKLHGFNKSTSGEVKLSSNSNQEQTGNSGTSLEENVSSCPLLTVVEFMRALISVSGEGRVILNVSTHPNQSYLKYLLLSPASEIQDIIKECRSVILAGGTMSPMEEFSQQLFLSAGACEDRVETFSCDHVVSDQSVLPIVMTVGPTNQKLDFTYTNRDSENLLEELSRILLNMCNIVPGGIVCFLPSYDYENKVFEYLQCKGFISKISKKKKVFREPKKASELDKLFSEYNKAIKNSTNAVTGAILFSVVGGKMSEGINFSDELGRMVIMVGLPYPNRFSVELKEKMHYLDMKYPSNSEGKTAGNVLYENLCFKAVNQSIGRAIRHSNDFASILLLDYRYEKSGSIKSLPSWISKNLVVHSQFASAFGAIRKFFIAKKSSGNP